MKTNYFSKTMLLMWKHYLLRRRRYFATALELFLPILIVFLLCKASAPFVDSPSEHKNASIYPSYKISDSFQGISLAYTPSTDFAKNIMDAVKTVSNVSHLEAFPDETQLKLFLSERKNLTKSDDWYGVVLISNSTTDEKFMYKIRNMDLWLTDSKFPQQELPGPAHGDPYLIKGFAGLQFALDAVYINAVNPQFSTYEYLNHAKFQPFPYPEYEVENPLRRLIPSVVCTVIILTSIILATPLISAIIEEKDSGLKELMKLVGLNESLIWLTWFLNAIVISVISYTIVTIILYYDFSGEGMASINNVSVTVFWSLIMLYCVANISFCFLFSAIFHSTAVASTLIVFTYLVLTYLSQYVKSKQSLFLNQVVCLTPVGALSQGFNRIAYVENHGIPLDWMSLSEVEVDSDVSLGFVFLTLLFDTFFYLGLAYYITMINPGKFGSPKSPFFIFEELISRLRNGNSTNELVNLEDPIDSKFFERPAANLSVSLQLKDLHKNFGSVYAVRNVNMNIYKGEITALLGHNGAGKTTTMGILTGTIKPTAGTITYEKEIDVLKQMELFRQDLGVCPQEDRLFSYLTALEHLMFFGMLKGYTKKDAENEGRNYLRLMEMEGKASSLPENLSGGMKRKLCLAIALMGSAKTLILDEPTSGMDVESRRKIWDLLLELRGSRTILLSTHYMEEADALGDRIAIMHHGTIVCHGTPMFLKKAYGTGYELTITIARGESASVLNSIVKNSIPQAVKESEKYNEIVYKLPLTETASFPKLFKNLEARQKDLNIVNMGVSCTTMEQVFLKVGGASMYDLAATETDSRKSRTEIDGNLLSGQLEYKKTGLALVTQQLLALFKKRYLFTSRDVNNLFSRVVFNTILTILFLRGLVEVTPAVEPPLDLSLSVYPDAKAIFASSSSEVCENLRESFVKNGIQLVNLDGLDIIRGLLDYGRNDLRSFRTELMFAAKCNNTKRTILYNRLGWHTLPIMINTWSNAILHQLGGNHQIVAVNHPISEIVPTCEDSETAMFMHIVYYIVLAFISIELLNYFSMYLCVERVDGFKHIQFMSNLSPLVYWIGTWAWDVTFFMTIFLLRALIYKTVDYYNFLALDAHFAVLIMVTFLFALSGLMFLYVTNYIATNKSRATTLISILNIVCIFVVGVYYAYLFLASRMGQPLESFYVFILKYVILLTPIFNYSLIVIKFVAIWINNTKCARCRNDELRANCEKNHQLSYLVFATPENFNGMLEETLFLVADVFLYAGLLMLIQMGYVARLWNFVCVSLIEKMNGRSKESVRVEEEEEDVDVKIERDAVRLLTASAGQQPNDYRNTPSNAILLVDGLKKIFMSWFKPFVAVSDVTFAVKPGQCFGLLGVNGAGKSTTFKMLTTYILPTAGDASIMNAKMSQNKTAYLKKIGYCAQTNCFVEELSGREMLALTASLRGVRTNRMKTLVDKWISIVGLESFQNQRCGTYSGGNKRKLCTAMSLIGDPLVVFLDEPTTGVDPVSRRKLYDVMEQSKQSGQAVVLSSHSMEECENLCDRLTIMSRGRMKCIGTIQHLKQRYAQGFSILIKLVDVMNGYTLVEDVKRELMLTFKPEFCILKDEHKGLLYYQIKDTSLLWSELFEKMERIKAENTVIDDYTISDTSLEEVFISFAKQASKD